jgi:hypothetical protein
VSSHAPSRLSVRKALIVNEWRIGMSVLACWVAGIALLTHGLAVIARAIALSVACVASTCDFHKIGMRRNSDAAAHLGTPPETKPPKSATLEKLASDQSETLSLGCATPFIGQAVMCDCKGIAAFVHFLLACLAGQSDCSSQAQYFNIVFVLKISRHFWIHRWWLPSINLQVSWYFAGSFSIGPCCPVSSLIACCRLPRVQRLIAPRARRLRIRRSSLFWQPSSCTWACDDWSLIGCPTYGLSPSLSHMDTRRHAYHTLVTHGTGLIFEL